jgi:hypothetical protein
MDSHISARATVGEQFSALGITADLRLALFDEIGRLAQRPPVRQRF